MNRREYPSNLEDCARELYCDIIEIYERHNAGNFETRNLATIANNSIDNNPEEMLKFVEACLSDTNLMMKDEVEEDVLIESEQTSSKHQAPAATTSAASSSTEPNKTTVKIQRKKPGQLNSLSYEIRFKRILLKYEPQSVQDYFDTSEREDWRGDEESMYDHYYECYGEPKMGEVEGDHEYGDLEEVEVPADSEEAIEYFAKQSEMATNQKCGDEVLLARIRRLLLRRDPDRLPEFDELSAHISLFSKIEDVQEQEEKKVSEKEKAAESVEEKQPENRFRKILNELVSEYGEENPDDIKVCFEGGKPIDRKIAFAPK